MLTNNYLLKLSDRIICSSDSKVVLSKLIKNLEKDMRDLARDLEFEKAAEVRDKIRVLREMILEA